MTYRIPPGLDDADAILPVEVPRWYVIRTLPRQEGRALRSFEHLGLRAYLPMAKVWRNPNLIDRDREAKEEPLFQGYLFAELTSAGIAAVKPPNEPTIMGVLDFVRRDGSPAPLGPLEVKRLYWLAYFESQGGTDYTWSPKPKRWNPKKGQQARIASGHYAGFSGKITELRGKNRITIMGEWFGIRRPVTVPVGDAEQMEAA